MDEEYRVERAKTLPVPIQHYYPHACAWCGDDLNGAGVFQSLHRFHCKGNPKKFFSDYIGGVDPIPGREYFRLIFKPRQTGMVGTWGDMMEKDLYNQMFEEPTPIQRKNKVGLTYLHVSWHDEMMLEFQRYMEKEFDKILSIPATKLSSQ
jgi:hypothetical protein